MSSQGNLNAPISAQQIAPKLSLTPLFAIVCTGEHRTPRRKAIRHSVEAADRRPVATS